MLSKAKALPLAVSDGYKNTAQDPSLAHRVKKHAYHDISFAQPGVAYMSVGLFQCCPISLADVDRDCFAFERTGIVGASNEFGPQT